MKKKESFAEWTTAEINNLPDSSFAYIESGGKKDSDGKTTPRSLRHLPYKDANGKADLPHVRNALARLAGTKIPESAKAGIKSKLEAILEKAKGSELHMIISAFEFDEDADAAEDAQVEIPSTIHLVPIGQWNHDAYGPIMLGSSDIREFVQNFNAGIRKGVPITAGHEGFAELPAQGWITSVEARDNGLWGAVEWNELGKETLSDKQYKFFSPEFYRDYEDPETHQIYRNVLTGGALTKSPYFKELQAVVFSDKNIKKQFNNNDNTMDISELLAKDVATLSDDEKVFLKDHKDELSEEQKTAFASVLEDAPAETAEEKEAREKKEAEDKTAAEEKAAGDANEAAGLNRDGSAKVAPAAEGGDGGGEGEGEGGEKVAGSEKIMISASELAILRQKADQGQQAFTELNKQKLDIEIKGLTFSESNKDGKFLPKSTDSLRAFMEGLNEVQRKAFTSLVAEVPTAKLFGEIGSGGAADGTARAEVDTKIELKLKANTTMKYSDALREVMSENEGLEERYDKELTPVRGSK